MSAVSPEFEPRRFRSTVAYYARYRLDYPRALLERLAELSGLRSGERVLDLGCGPGLVALGMARLGADVVAVDPEADMLEAGRQAAAEAGLAVDFREGSSYALPRDLGAVKLVTMGRSFHWMDRAATLEALAKIVVPGGAVALLADVHPETLENRWRGLIEGVAKRHGIDIDMARRRRNADGRSHVSHLLDSAFNDIETAGVFLRRNLTVDDILGRVLSLSVTSPERLGERQSPFLDDLRADLLAQSPDGQFTEIVETRAIVARRR